MINVPQETMDMLQQAQENAMERLRKKKAERDAKTAHIRQITAMEVPMDWENLFAGDSQVEGVHAESISDGLVLCLSNLGRVDIEYISAITGQDMKTVICALKGSIYQNPDTWEECFYRGWETAEQYLSGNVVRKWKRAQEADKEYDGYFADNIRALAEVLPKILTAKDIYVTLGSPWVPADVIEDFIGHILNVRKGHYAKVLHDAYTGSWEITNKSFYSGRVASHSTYGTDRISALHILERTLNMRTVSVTEEVGCASNKSGKKRVVNQRETISALEKQQKLIREFQKWVWKDKDRKERLEMIFEQRYGSTRIRRFDGSFLKFPTMSPAVDLYPYQKNAVARILFSPNTLLAHDVGSGKTFIMIAAGMELRRMGLSRKNLYVVPNDLVGQWQRIFLQMYPHAKLKCVEPKVFTPQRRERTLEDIRDGDYDGVLMAYSCFEQIPLSQEYYIRQLEQLRQELQTNLEQEGTATGHLRRRAKNVNEALFKEITKAVSGKGDIYFDELGITRLFVDEAHNFKNVPIETKTDKVLGISAAGSRRCRDMMDKVHMVQKQNGGGGVIMATGTPITNSITDVFIMQKYLQSGALALLDLQSFDSWVGMFAEKVTEFEVDVDTSSYRLATRFARFHNLPELTGMLAEVADFHRVDRSDGIPDFDGYTDALVGKTPQFEKYLKQISERADSVRGGFVDRTEDNMLKITTDGRKAALDLRLVEPENGFTWQSKVARCSENVASIYRKSREQKWTQLVFCDTSTPKKGFNIYDELKRLLVEKGVKADEIAYIHSANTEKRRGELFDKVRKGEIRVLIGSTFKLGLGVNVQDRLAAIHHLDVPWRPADMTQREGRILRQGNRCEKAEIFRYITEGSFDAYSWQLLETKQRFITGLLSGSLEERSGKDIEDTVLDYAEVKALAVGNPVVKLRVETANELSRLLILQRKARDTRILLEKERMELPGKITYQERLIANCREDILWAEEMVVELDQEVRRNIRRQLFQVVRDNVLQPKERLATVYQGFQLVLPANMVEEHPFLWLQHKGRYYVELGEAEKGCLIRVDNVIEGLPLHLEKLERNLEDMRVRHLAIDEELRRMEDFSVRIEECRKKLEKLDKRLGVDAA